MPAKRKSRNTETPAVKRSKSSNKWIGTKFGQLLNGAGLVLGPEHKLRVDPAVFKRELTSAFRKSDDASIGEFIQGLRDYMENPTRLKASVMPTGIMEGEDIRPRFGGLDCLMRLLMGVTVLQPLVIDVLLEWLPDYMSDGGEMDGMEFSDYLLMPKLMLSQLRMLDHLVNGKDLCDKLLELVEIATPEMKREIIISLPEILDDPQHNQAAQKLKSLLETSSGLVSAILDALSNLNIANYIAAEILDAALNSLQSADIDDLPTVIKYINGNLTPRSSKEVVSEMREKLCLDISPIPIISSTPLTQQRQSLKTSGYFIVLDTIRSSICFQKPVADGWIKAITSVTSPENHLVIDVFVLFVLHSITTHKKNVEKIFASKIKAGCLSDDLMNSVFSSHPGALKHFFQSLLQLSEVLLCSSSPSVSIFAVSLYQHLFTSFEDIFCQQKVVDALVTLINNGMRSEVDHALDILLSLLEHHCKAVLRFTPLIKTVLDYLGHMTILQIRKLYQILGVLAFEDFDNGSSMQSELHMIIRKQLTHFEPRYRHFGVVGSVMTIHQIARHSDNISDNISDDIMMITGSQSIIKRKEKMAKTMLDEVMVTCSRSKECSVLFCDEMCSVVSQLDNSILEYLCQQVTTNFQDTFLVEVTDGVPTSLGLPLKFLYSLDSTDEGSIALNLLPMIKAGEGVAKGEGLVGMAAQFHLLRTCEHHLNGNLEAIDALLGCPVLMSPNEETFSDLPEGHRVDICLSIFYCINWFRELVCAFVEEDDIEMRGKVIIRLKNITDLQDQLETCMTATPGFWPPSVTTSEESSSTTVYYSKGKSSKNDVTLASMAAATQHIDKDATAMDKTLTPSVPIDRLRPYFRELTLPVFKVFHYESLSRTILDSELNTKEQEELRLETPQMIFLLQDLANKVITTFTTTFGHKVGKGDDRVSYTSAELVNTMTNMMPALCERLENTSAYFQARLADNDGIMDVGGSNELLYPQSCLYFHLLLKILSVFFAWPSLSDLHYSKDLKSCLVSILSSGSSQHSSSSSSSSLSLLQMALGVCKYVERFSDFLPTLSCGHALAKVMVAISKTCKAEEVHPIVSVACGSLLKRPWRAVESTQLKNAALTFLLKYHMEWSRDTLAVIESIASDATVELMGEEAQEQSSKYPTLSSTTFPCFYRVMMSSMVTNIKAISIDQENLEENFYTLQVSTKVFVILVNLVQAFSKRTVLSTALRTGRSYIESFIKCGMPMMNIMFRSRKDDVLAVLKTLQQSTRFLQHCCGHSKVVKDTNLINHVPNMKKSLETLIFRVKELMSNHNCLDAFQVGNLKNRDLKGQEILSQLPSEAGDDEEEELDMENEEDSGSNSTDTRIRDDEVFEISSEASGD